MRPPLTPISDALQQVLENLSVAADRETVSLPKCSGRVLAADVMAPIDVPPADNSAMDGYAVEAGSVQRTPITLPVSQRIPAGQAGVPLKPGSAARIFTGAPIPPGANAVVMQENAEPQDQSVTILQPVEAGENIRSRGDDISKGTLLFRAGHRIRVQDLHILASCGIEQLEVRRPLRVAILTTGDELVRPGTSLEPGQIYNSNFYLLSALLEQMGMEVLDCGTPNDDLEATVAGLDMAAGRADCIISSGGVSVGEEDHVKAAVQRLGHIGLWKLAVKPGKPFAWGEVKNRPFFGLPGNPVSAFVTFVLLVRPALLTLSGAFVEAPLGFCLPAAFEATSGERQEYLRVVLDSDKTAGKRLRIVDNQSSGAGSSLSLADGLAVLPPFTSLKQGDMLEFIPFSELVG